MSDSENEDEALSATNLAKIGKEIERKKRQFPDMFVSGWDDPDADEGVEAEKNPRETPQKEILWAAENGELERVLALLDADPALARQRDRDDYTPLHRACYNDHVRVVDLLLERGASAAARAKTGWRPLHSACHWNRRDCAERLLAAGADVNARSEGEQTALHVAAAATYSDGLLRTLLSHPDVDVFVANRSGDLPRDVARRSGLNAPLFDAKDPHVSYVRSPRFTRNPFAAIQ